MIDISYIMGFIGVAVGLIIGILIYSEVEASIDCPAAATNADGNEACLRAKSIAWTVISILPITMFFALFAIFGGFSRVA
jgi:ABC-type lipoprotein release transport system permease subunit|tara:strand:- start:485 stop:724 length:240 start_codon:yes stop_codon:yes gene_type:complete